MRELQKTIRLLLAMATAVLAAGVFARALGVGDVLPLALSDDKSVQLILKERMPSPLGGSVFIADVDGLLGVGNAIVLGTDDGFVADIQDFPNRKTYKAVVSAGGVKVEEHESPGRGQCGCCMLVPDLPATVSTGDVTARFLYSAPTTSDLYVDMLVAYDKKAASWADVNGGGITNFAQVSVQKMNMALANTGLDAKFRFRLVGVMRLDVSSVNLERILNDATSGKGAWAPIKAMRNKVGADIVTVLADTGTAYGMTGIGWSLTAKTLSSFSEYAYNACAIRAVAVSHAMTHEVGHNMGAGHADKIAYKSERGPQLYKYSSGYYMGVWFPVDGIAAGQEYRRYHTIMAYDEDGYGNTYEELPYFSSADHAYEVDGQAIPVGDATHDNTRTLRNSCAIVSQWRAQKVPDGAAITLPPDPGTEGATVTFHPETSCDPNTAVRFFGEQIVSLETDVPDAQIYYTLDGTEPTRESAVYNGPFCLQETTHVKAIVIAAGEELPCSAGDGLYRRVEPVTVGFDAGGGECTLTRCRVAKGFAVGALPYPTWAGHFFEGWWTDAGELVTEDKVIEDDLVLHARWTESPFETGGDVCWTHEGAGRYRSGTAKDGQTTWIEASVLGAGVLSFRWKASSEKGYDYLRLYIDDTLAASTSGNVAWTRQQYDVHGAGPHTFRWEYAKDYSAAEGEDCAWLEGFAWVPRDEVAVEAVREQSGAKGTVATSPKNGLVAHGGTVTLTAKTANKNTVFAYWTDEDGRIVGYTPTLKIKAEGDKKYKAVFRRKSACTRPVFSAAEPYGVDGHGSTNSMVGVAFNAQVTVNKSAYPVQFSAKGLPKGLKINATTGVISGFPTKAGKFTATITAKSAANTKLKASSKKLKIEIAALPAWARGTFAGTAYAAGRTYATEENGPRAPGGQVTLGVGATGKISGKLVAGGTNWTFTASGWSAASMTDGIATNAADCSFVASGTATCKVGKTTFKKAWRMELKANVSRDGQNGIAPSGATAAVGTLGDLAFESQRNFWKDKDAVGMLTNWAGAYAWLTPNDEALTLAVDANGGVKVTGIVDGGRKLALSTTLVLQRTGTDTQSYAVYIYAPPATVTTKNKKGKVIGKKVYSAFIATVELRNWAGTPVAGLEIAFRK